MLRSLVFSPEPTSFIRCYGDGLFHIVLQIGEMCNAFSGISSELACLYNTVNHKDETLVIFSVINNLVMQRSFYSWISTLLNGQIVFVWLCMYVLFFQKVIWHIFKIFFLFLIGYFVTHVSLVTVSFLLIFFTWTMYEDVCLICGLFIIFFSYRVCYWILFWR